MKRHALAALTLAALALAAGSARAVTGGTVVRDRDGLRSSVVQIESSRGELCSGALIAPDLVLTAAHCVIQRAIYQVVGVDRGFRRIPVRALAAATHPDFVPGTTPRTQPGVDLAIIKLAEPLGPDFTPFDLRSTAQVRPGEPVDLAGFGFSAEDKRRSARILRQTRLVSLGTLEVANRVLVVADSSRLAETTGAGACRGDSGGTIVRGGPGGYQLLGIVSWSSGALPAGIVTGIRGCRRFRNARCLGRYDHSGGTERRYRQDAVAATVALLHHLESVWLAQERAGADLVFTAGELYTDSAIHAPSKVAGETHFVLDIRSVTQGVMDVVAAEARDAAARIAADYRVRFELGETSDSPAAVMDPRIRGALKAQFERPFEMASGAGHDAATFAAVGIPSGMIFVRNDKGSHNADESMQIEDFAVGARALANLILSFPF